MKTNQEMSARERLESILPEIVANQTLHGRWLNSLSYMEHIGATKIARTQSGQSATFMVLKHASEEARHGFYLKRLARKVWPNVPDTFQDEGLLAARASRQYLYLLDIRVSKMLRAHGFEGRTLRDLAYLLVTYGIEERADDLYPVYQALIEDYPVKISVRTIINEEEGHLEEMEHALSLFDFDTRPLMKKALEIEDSLFLDWVSELEKEVAGERVPV